MGFVAWIVVGLIAGWLAGQVMKGGGYGLLMDIVLGILGGILGGWIFGMLGNLARRGNDGINDCRVCRGSDSRLDYPLVQESVKFGEERSTL